jgi:hypothetical protein
MGAIDGSVDVLRAAVEARYGCKATLFYVANVINTFPSQIGMGVCTCSIWRGIQPLLELSLGPFPLRAVASGAFTRS